MTRTLLVSVVLFGAMLLVGGSSLAQNAPDIRTPQDVHVAVIKITKTKVTNAQRIRVTTRITGLTRPGAHWKLLWKKKGTKQKAKNMLRVKGNQKGKAVLTKKVGAGTWIVRAVLVKKNGVPFKARQFPAATLSAKKTVKVKKPVLEKPNPPPPGKGNCHPSYPTVCIPPPPPDLDCGDIAFSGFKVVGTDPHRFDGDRDGVGCES